MNSPQSKTKQGFETQFGINVIGTFLLTKLFLSKLKESKGRAVFLSSVGHSIHGASRIDIDYYRNYDEKNSKYDGWKQYQQSKLGDILLAKEFHRRDGIDAASLHPGFINTNLDRTSSNIFLLFSIVFK